MTSVFAALFLSPLACRGETALPEPTTQKHVPYQVAEWLPSNQRILNGWNKRLVREADSAEPPPPLQPVIQELKDLIDNDAQLYAGQRHPGPAI